MPTKTQSRLQRVQLIITTAWVGSIWTVGYLVAPTLFATLPDQMQAGSVAAQLFRVEAWFSVVSAGLMLALLNLASSNPHGSAQSAPRLTSAAKLVMGMLTCTLLGYFSLHPFMAELRASGLTLPDAKLTFGLLHAVSSGIYLLQSILGGLLVGKISISANDVVQALVKYNENNENVMDKK